MPEIIDPGSTDRMLEQASDRHCNVEEEFEDIVDYDNEELLDGGDDEDDFYIGDTVSHTQADDRFDGIVGVLEDIAVSKDFQDLMHNFCDENCAIFDAGEENKLEYTSVFTKWTRTIEGFIEEQLKQIFQGFNMTDFLQELGRRKKVEDEIMDEVLELLISASDFETFKQLMLTHKESRIANEKNLSVAGVASKIYRDEDEEGEVRPDLDLLCISSSVK